MKKIMYSAMYLFCTIPFGILIGISFWLFRFLGIARIQGWKNFPRWREKVLVVSNHPSLLEPIILIGLFFPQYLFRPFKFGPWNLPDKKNYYNSPFFYLMRPRLIPIDRGNRSAEVRSLIQATHVLSGGSPMIIFPEGGRTFKGEKFLESKGGKKIREFKQGFAWLAKKTGATVVPVWVEGTDRVSPNAQDASYAFPRFWRRVRISLGRPLIFKNESVAEITRTVQAAVLALADQPAV